MFKTSLPKYKTQKIQTVATVLRENDAMELLEEFRDKIDAADSTAAMVPMGIGKEEAYSWAP
jgi:hypothetical protein